MTTALFKRTPPSGTSLDEAARRNALKFAELECEIFEEGIHGGKKFGKAEVDEAVRNYNEWGKDIIKSPLVLGHDEKQPLIQNLGMPSLGEMKSCRTIVKPNGKTAVIGKFSDVPELAAKAIQQRRYRRISSEIYENFSNPNIDGGKEKGLSFRRIALLGADVPEVKTLADVVMLGEENVKVFFAEPEEETMDQATIQKMIQEAVEAEAAKNKKAFDAFSEQNKATLDALKAENAQLKKDNESLAADRAKEIVANRRAAIASFIEGQKAAGKILPAWEKLGLKRFMEGLDSAKVLKFSEEKDAAEVSELAFFEEFVKALPKVVELSEITADDLGRIAAAKGGDQGGKKNVALAAAVDKRIKEARKAGTILKYAEALNEVVRENPELAE